MNRSMRRASNWNGRRMQNLDWNEFEDVTQKVLESRTFENKRTFLPDKVYQNNKYIVFINNNNFRNGKYYTRVMVRRSDSQAIYSWQDLYRIKNELFGEEVEAIQIMPKVSDLVDDANLYWFFIESEQ